MALKVAESHWPGRQRQEPTHGQEGAIDWWPGECTRTRHQHQAPRHRPRPRPGAVTLRPPLSL